MGAGDSSALEGFHEASVLPGARTQGWSRGWCPSAPALLLGDLSATTASSRTSLGHCPTWVTYSAPLGHGGTWGTSTHRRAERAGLQPAAGRGAATCRSRTVGAEAWHSLARHSTAEAGRARPSPAETLLERGGVVRGCFRTRSQVSRNGKGLRLRRKRREGERSVTAPCRAEISSAQLPFPGGCLTWHERREHRWIPWHSQGRAP